MRLNLFDRLVNVAGRCGEVRNDFAFFGARLANWLATPS
jgi:hypothetical protein